MGTQPWKRFRDDLWSWIDGEFSDGGAIWPTPDDFAAQQPPDNDHLVVTDYMRARLKAAGINA